MKNHIFQPFTCILLRAEFTMIGYAEVISSRRLQVPGPQWLFEWELCDLSMGMGSCYIGALNWKS